MDTDERWKNPANGSTLSYRTGPDAAWQGEREKAILVPPDTKQIQVNRPGTALVIVDVH